MCQAICEILERRTFLSAGYTVAPGNYAGSWLELGAVEGSASLRVVSANNSGNYRGSLQLNFADVTYGSPSSLPAELAGKVFTAQGVGSLTGNANSQKGFVIHFAGSGTTGKTRFQLKMDFSNLFIPGSTNYTITIGRDKFKGNLYIASPVVSISQVPPFYDDYVGTYVSGYTPIRMELSEQQIMVNGVVNSQWVLDMDSPIGTQVVTIVPAGRLLKLTSPSNTQDVLSIWPEEELTARLSANGNKLTGQYNVQLWTEPGIPTPGSQFSGRFSLTAVR